MTRKAIGTRGSWFAAVEGELFPCVHTFWYKAGRYDDPHYAAGDRQWEELIAAIQEKRLVILTQDDAIDGGKGFNRTAYVGLFSIDEIEAVDGHLRFRMVKRIEDLK